MVKVYKTISELAKALAEGEIPPDVVSPGYAASLLGLTRYAVYKAAEAGRIRAWKGEFVILVSEEDVLKWKRERERRER